MNRMLMYGIAVSSCMFAVFIARRLRLDSGRGARYDSFAGAAKPRQSLGYPQFAELCRHWWCDIDWCAG